MLRCGHQLFCVGVIGIFLEIIFIETVPLSLFGLRICLALVFVFGTLGKVGPQNFGLKLRIVFFRPVRTSPVQIYPGIVLFPLAKIFAAYWNFVMPTNPSHSNRNKILDPRITCSSVIGVREQEISQKSTKIQFKTLLRVCPTNFAGDTRNQIKDYKNKSTFWYNLSICMNSLILLYGCVCVRVPNLI